MRIGRYDIQGIIQGAETEKPKLAAAYEDAARLALSSMERALPSSIVEPPASAAINNQTTAIMAAVSGRGDETSPIQIYIDKMEVQEESDVERVARELYRMAAQESRSGEGEDYMIHERLFVPWHTQQQIFALRHRTRTG